MCGIAGFYSPNAPVPHARLLEMSEAIRHRGPDDYGYVTFGARAQLRTPLSYHLDPADASHLALAHRRLSIVDLSDAGRQPLASRDGAVWITYNGEIYNYLELRRELERSGATFVGDSDTEVLVAAYERWGMACLERLVGMFAFCLLDLRRARLYLVRDFFGVKPLYYTVRGNQLFFASEVKGLLGVLGAPKVDSQVAFDYLAHGLCDHVDATFFEGVTRVPAAHYLTLDLSRSASGRLVLEPTRYWRLDPTHTLDVTLEEAALGFRDLFEESVALHLRSDVPVGSCLSGGLDSSAIVCTADRLLAGRSDLHTFSYIAREEAIDESPYIDIINQHVRATPHSDEADPEALVRDLETLIHVQDYPFGSTSIYAQWRVFKLARQHCVKVMLDGQGADELLAGYKGYLGAYCAQTLARGQLGEAARTFRRFSRDSDVSALMMLYWTGTFMLPNALHRAARRAVGEPLVPAWLSADWIAGHVNMPVGAPTGVRRRRHALKENLMYKFGTYSLPALLRYEDRNSMAHSVESRVPFLTPKLVAFAFALPDNAKIANGLTKAVLRQAARGTVPDAVLDRRDKVGFATPEQTWLRGPLATFAETTIRSEVAQAIPIFDHPELLAAFKQVQSGQARWNFRVWRWLNLIAWTKQYNVRWH